MKKITSNFSHTLTVQCGQKKTCKDKWKLELEGSHSHHNVR
jgi:hypothetical protein